MERTLLGGIVLAVVLVCVVQPGLVAAELGQTRLAFPVVDHSCENPVRPICCFFPWLC